MTYNKALGLLLVFSLVFVTACSNLNAFEDYGDPHVVDALITKRKNWAGGGYPYDLDNPDLVAACADYVFVGRVERYVGTRYLDTLPLPQTDYDVVILKVIKGNLESGQKIPITKNGGISKDKSYIDGYYNGEFMLETGVAYVFLVTVDPDRRTLSFIGPHGSVPLESSIEAELKRIEESKEPNKQRLISKTLEQSEVFARYVAACENKDAAAELPPRIRDRERFRSVYEK